MLLHRRDIRDGHKDDPTTSVPGCCRPEALGPLRGGYHDRSGLSGPSRQNPLEPTMRVLDAQYLQAFQTGWKRRRLAVGDGPRWTLGTWAEVRAPEDTAQQSPDAPTPQFRYARYTRNGYGANPYASVYGAPALVDESVLRALQGTAYKGERSPEHHHVGEYLSCHVAYGIHQEILTTVVLRSNVSEIVLSDPADSTRGLVPPSRGIRDTESEGLM